MADRPTCATRSASSPARASASSKLDPGATHGCDKASASASRPAPARAPRATSRTGSGPRPSARSSSSSRASTPPARTARSARSWRRSTRRAARSRRSRCRRAEELAHDYLWRVHKRGPAQGRDRDLQPVALRGRPRRARPRPRPEGGLVEALRPDQRLRADADRRRARRSSSSSCTSTATSSASASRRATTIPTKRWKFSMGDLAERKLWDDYQAAFDDALSKTSTDAGAVVRHPGQPQLVPQPRGRDDPRRHDRRPQARLPARAGPAPNLVIE